MCGYPEQTVDEERSPRVSLSGKKKKQIEEEWKWIEAQLCGLCSIGGDILCCETCPASFHLSCIGIEASEVPDGAFHCHRCTSLPKDVQLFAPETCTSTTPQHRVGYEFYRNWEAIRWQYKRLKKEPTKPVQGPLTEMDSIDNTFPDCHLKNALTLINSLNYSFPSRYTDAVKKYPDDSMEVKRSYKAGETCVQCELQDDWSPMLLCDFCEQPWHQKCVYPPMITMPKRNYWMCPRHTAVRIDNLVLGEELTRNERNVLIEKYGEPEVSFELFEKFCNATIERRIGCNDNLDVIYYAPVREEVASCVSPVLIHKKNNWRKGGRGKKKAESRYFDTSYGLEDIPDAFSSSSLKNLRKISDNTLVERKDRVLDQLDQKRSQQLTEDELLSTIMPYDEVIKMMRGDLDPKETIRGSGIQSICALPDKIYRKKLKADIDLLIQFLGFGNDHDERKFSSFQTEAFFRRCTPPPSAQNTLCQKSLREVLLNSQKEALELSQVYKYHPDSTKIDHFVLLAHDIYFESAEERDSYFPSSMTIWSKEPIMALTAKWAKQSCVKIKEESPAEPVDDKMVDGGINAIVASINETTSSGPILGVGSSEVIAAHYVVDPAELESTGGALESNEPQGPLYASSQHSSLQSPQQSPQQAYLNIEFKEDGPNIAQYINDSGPLEQNIAEAVGRLSLDNFEDLKYNDYQEKAVSIYEYPGYLGEDDWYEADVRRAKSLNDLVDKPIWSHVNKNMQNFLLREQIETMQFDHDYAAIDRRQISDDSVPNDLHNYISSESVKDRYEYEERESQSPDTEFLSPNPPDGYENYDIRRRGRPKGSKNRKEGEPIRPRKKYPTSSSGRSRGRGGRPRSIRGSRGTPSAASSFDEEGPSRRRSVTFSSDAPDSPEQSIASVSKRIQEEVDEAREKYAKLMLTKNLEEDKDTYFSTRNDALESWTAEQRKELTRRVITGRLSSLIPFEARYFLPSQRVLARVEIDDYHLSIAIQRCLTKIGTAQDCHIRIDKLADSFCNDLADYHCDIIREYHSNEFYLSTLATEMVIVNDVVICRPRLTHFEEAERNRSNGSIPFIPSNIRCQCRKRSDQRISNLENNGQVITSGIVKLEDGALIQIGCVVFKFFKNS
ncbi:hypothetical protein GCK72_010384 [Caenorhabditis remanei]|uniref:PHD-type domain-containing protein n=1 Tax=Caenorhabditis remanei TaxID=31234 RepID=A0A6A5H6W9_CAERE|nr:hypothetical protein GCK72_010384 [Caenorhabditis remanei]KAF1762122.1 hypothetical protein GCK72_010384 [Caenorhabditis remanei]